MPKIMKEDKVLTSESVIAEVIYTNQLINENEATRQMQETNRQNNTTTAITNANVATNNANEKATLADNAATNANDKANLANIAATNANNIATQLETETLKIFKPSVATYGDIATTYPSPENGWDTIALDTSIEWRYNSTTTSWVNLGVKSEVNTADSVNLGIVKGGGNVDIAIDGTLSVPDLNNSNKETIGSGVLYNSGLLVSAQSTPNMTVSVTTGTAYMPNGTRMTPVANTSLAITTADTTNPRIDIVYVDSTGVISYLAGIASATPTAPSLPSGGILLAEISVLANATTITSSNITDKRTIIKSNIDLVNKVNENTLQLADNTKQIGKIVNPKMFGAVGGGNNDDTTALQAAIDYCLSKTSPIVNGQSLIPILEIDDVYLVTSPLKIDRPENQTGFFRIRGCGTVGGFTTNQAIYIFSTNYVGSKMSDPSVSVLSNQVSFENLTFSSTIVGAKAIDLKKFVRTQVKGCYFENIQLDISAGDDYIQSATIIECFARGITGKFISSTDMYDVKIHNCLFEVISDTIIYVSGKIIGCAITHNIAENCQGMFVNANYGQGLEMNGNYIEALVGRSLRLEYAMGVIFNGNYVFTRGSDGTTNNQADTTFFEVYITECYGFSGASNYFSHRGYQFEGTNKFATVGNGDYAEVMLIKDVSTLNRKEHGQVTNNGRMALYTSPTTPVLDNTLVLQEANDSGVGGSLNLNNTSGGVSTENIVRFSHQSQVKGAIKSTLNADGYGSGNVAIQTLGYDGSWADRMKINSSEISITDSINFKLGTTNGTSFGSTSTEKLSFYGKTPVVQPTSVANATNTTDVITQLNDLLAKLRALGIIAT